MSNVKFKYFGDTSKAYTNVLTVTSELTYKEDVGYVIKFGYCFSNIEDKYNKVLGRNLALKRLEDIPFMINLGLSKPTYKQIDEVVLKYILKETNNIPPWYYKWYKIYTKPSKLFQFDLEARNYFAYAPENNIGIPVNLFEMYKIINKNNTYKLDNLNEIDT